MIWKGGRKRDTRTGVIVAQLRDLANLASHGLDLVSRLEDDVFVGELSTSLIQDLEKSECQCASSRTLRIE